MSFRYFIFACVDNFCSFNSSCQTILATNVVMYLKACWVSCKYIVVMHLKACWVSCKYIVVMHFHLFGSILQMHCCHAVWSKHYLIMHCYACLVSCKNFVVKQCQAFCHTFLSCTLTVDFYYGQIGHTLFCFFPELVYILHYIKLQWHTRYYVSIPYLLKMFIEESECLLQVNANIFLSQILTFMLKVRILG